MTDGQLDRTPSQVRELTDAMDRLGKAVVSGGGALGGKLDAAADRMEGAVRLASAASERHAKSLVCATWALVLATAVLVVVTAVHAYIAFVHAS